MRTTRRAAAAAIALLTLATVAGARAPRGQGAGTLPAEASEFDFFIGKWKVGERGFDKIKRFGTGIAVLESYTEGAYTGASVNVYDVASGTWTQTWLASDGGYFQLTGKKIGDDLVLVGDFKDPRDGTVKLLRLSFVTITKNSFTQKYETSTDDGATWTVINTIPFVRMKG